MVNGKIIEFNFFNYVVDLFTRLDEGGVKAHDNFLNAEHYLGNLYQEDILGRKVKDAWTQFEMNPVEHLTYNTMHYEYMQLYTTYDIYELYKLNWNEWFDQPIYDVEFQLKIARQLYAIKQKELNKNQNETDPDAIEAELRRTAEHNQFPGKFRG